MREGEKEVRMEEDIGREGGKGEREIKGGGEGRRR